MQSNPTYGASQQRHQQVSLVHQSRAKLCPYLVHVNYFSAQKEEVQSKRVSSNILWQRVLKAMEERRPWNGMLKLWHALLYTVGALANFCVLEMVWVFVAMLILGAYSDQNPRAIFWRISIIYHLDQYYNLQQTIVAFMIHVW